MLCRAAGRFQRKRNGSSRRAGQPEERIRGARRPRRARGLDILTVADRLPDRLPPCRGRRALLPKALTTSRATSGNGSPTGTGPTLPSMRQIRPGLHQALIVCCGVVRSTTMRATCARRAASSSARSSNSTLSGFVWCGPRREDRSNLVLWSPRCARAKAFFQFGGSGIQLARFHFGAARHGSPAAVVAHLSDPRSTAATLCHAAAQPRRSAQ